MAIANPDRQTTVTFITPNGEYSASVRRAQIVHEAFHAALPKEMTVGSRLTFRTEAGVEIFADNFVGDLEDHFGATRLVTTATKIPEHAGEWRNIGFDHLAITVGDRAGARDFFRDVLQLQVMRDDAHMTVVASGPTALFLFDAGVQAPLSSGVPSSWHHIGFVVDDIDAAYHHLRRHESSLLSDFAMLERDERWSLYFFYRNGDVTFMIQFSQIKADARGFAGTPREGFPALLYDYASRPYGLQWDASGALIGARANEEKGD
jgi:catechol 2,3-dioxygenase-like lactoylglutathione lyase family enzyme